MHLYMNMKNLAFLFGIMLMMGACSRAPAEQESLKTFVRQLAELQQGVSAEEAEWKQRLSSLSMENVLLPSNLVTPQGRASGKQKLKQFRALIAERADRRNVRSNKFQQIIEGIADVDMRDSARAGRNAHHEESVKAAAELDQSQLQLANAYDAILNWCEREGKGLTEQANQLRLSTPVQQTQLDSLLATLKAAETRETVAVWRMEDLRHKAQRESGPAAS